MKRRELILAAGAPIVMQAIPLGFRRATSSGRIPQTPIELSNGDFRLELALDGGLRCRLQHLPTHTLLADGDYSYSFGAPEFFDVRQEGSSVVLAARTQSGLMIEHRFSVDPESTWLEDSLRITNEGRHPYIHAFRSGFVLPVREDTLPGYVFSALPLRREVVPAGYDPENRLANAEHVAASARTRYLDFSLDDILHRRRWNLNFYFERPEYQTFGAPMSMRPSAETYAAEAWMLTGGKAGFLISKYNQAQREYAILDRVYLPNRIVGLRWGGTSSPDDMYSHIHLAPGASCEFGTTRLSAFEGGLERGFRVFRAEMESRGHGTPENFDPPVLWNELYDNELLRPETVDRHADPERRKKFYSLPQMQDAASKAQLMGCDALYLDPGWDEPQSSKIWGESRLGGLDAFIAMLRERYGGLKLALHTPLSYWTGRGGFDVIPGTALVNALGAETAYACGASVQYLEETARRLRVLADAGVCFFMFDGAFYRGDCWNPKHQHSVPSTLDEHMHAINKLARMIHETHPNVLIETHDQAQWFPLFVPIYFGQMTVQGVRGFDERWGYELMWNPMDDLRSGSSLALYYYNLAYSLPLYLHVDLRTDNRNGVVFWWTASTCRHLGIGGTHADPAVFEVHRQAMRTYQRLKPYFARGIFHGIDEMTHVHVARDGRSAVMNCFNLQETSTEREIRFDPSDLGLDTRKAYRFSGAAFRKVRDLYVGRVQIAALGHTLIEVT